MSVKPGDQITVMYDFGTISGPYSNYRPLHAVVKRDERDVNQACFELWFHAALDAELYQPPVSLFVDREGIDWCRGWDNDAVTALIAARALGAE